MLLRCTCISCFLNVLSSMLTLIRIPFVIVLHGASISRLYSSFECISKVCVSIENRTLKLLCLLDPRLELRVLSKLLVGDFCPFCVTISGALLVRKKRVLFFLSLDADMSSFVLLKKDALSSTVLLRPFGDADPRPSTALSSFKLLNGKEGNASTPGLGGSSSRDAKLCIGWRS